MHFKATALIAVTLAVTKVHALFSSERIVDTFDHITSASADAEKIIDDLSLATLVTTAPKLIFDLTQVVVTVAADIGDVENAGPSDAFGEDDQRNICSSFKKFVKVEGDLLSTVAEKAGVLVSSPLPFSSGIAIILNNIEEVVDKLVAGFVDSVPICSDDIKQEKKAFQGKLDETLDKLNSST